MDPRASRVVRFIENYCTIEDGVPMKLMPFQRKFLAGVYTGEPDAPRTVTRGLLSTGRKNGKSNLAAALALCHIVGPEAEAGREAVSTATTEDQANEIFKPMQRMIKANRHFSDRLEVTASNFTVVNRKTACRFRTISSRPSSAQGKNLAVWFYDELAQAKDQKLYNALDYSQGAVEGGGFGMVLSTFSDEPMNPLGELIDMVQRGQAKGEMRHWHCAVYRADPDKNLYSMANIRRANPGMPRTPSPASVRREIEEAKASPVKRAFFIAYRLNLMAAPNTALVDPIAWREAQHEKPQAELFEELKGEPVQLGLDLSDRTDLTSLAAFFPMQQILLGEFWLPRLRLEVRSAEDRVPYKQWAEEGHLLTTPGEAIAPAVIAERIREMHKAFKIVSLRYDPWGFEPVQRAMEERYLHRVKLQAIRQGFKTMSPAIDNFDQLRLDDNSGRRLRHGGNPVMMMCFMNCRVEFSSDSVSPLRKPVKASETQRIDGAVAALMATMDLGEKMPAKGASLAANMSRM